MTDQRLGARGSVLSFVFISALATSLATGLFVLLDPRAQAYWAARWDALTAMIRSLFGGG